VDYFYDKEASGSSTQRWYTRDQVWNVALRSALDQTDEELREKGFPQPEMLLPKLVLLVAVMDVFAIPWIVFYPCLGSNPGLLLCPEYYS
jgi:hypothetical protein